MQPSYLSHQDHTLPEQEESLIRKKAQTQYKYFKKVQMSVTAATKILNHATFGIPIEVMGLLTGSFRQQKGSGIFTITDMIVLPVQASETRVTADDETYTLIAAYTEWLSKIKTHNIIGWYHSHPSYGCWLSGIDVNTQQRFQNNSDPFLAIVCDPVRSANLKKVDLGAFRVHPKGFMDQNAGQVSNQDVPRRKAVDFGVYYKKYYQLPIELITNRIGLQTLKNVEKMEWASELASSSFFTQKRYLTQEVKEQKIDFDEFLQVKQSPNSKYEEIKQKQKQTMKKVGTYAKERNVSLMDSAIKSLLF